MLESLHQLGELSGELEGDFLRQQREFERACGLPWNSTVSALAERYGVDSWRGFQPVVPLNGIDALGFSSVETRFRHRLFEPRRSYPAYEFQAELNRFASYQANHTWALQHLAVVLGADPRNADVSNCLRAVWQFGLIRVSVLTFLPEKRFGSNPLYDSQPDLWQVANLTVESCLCAYREPAATNVSDGFAVTAPGVLIGRGDFLTNRLLLQPYARVGLWVWRDRTLGRVGVANRWASIVRPWNTASRLLLRERTPARGGGSASLEWDGVELLESPAWDGLRSVAPDIAKFLGTSLETHSEPDE